MPFPTTGTRLYGKIGDSGYKMSLNLVIPERGKKVKLLQTARIMSSGLRLQVEELLTDKDGMM